MALRIAFMGTPHFALPSLKALMTAGHSIVAVYSQPPRPKGRGYALQKSPIHEYAESQGIPVFTPLTLKDPEEQQRFKALDLDIAVVVAYGLILPKAVLEAPRWGCVNVHASLLPRWRGAAPIQHAILAGDSETGVTIMQMDEGLDTGSMLSQKMCLITSETTSTSLHDQLAALGAKLLIPTLADYVSGAAATPQPRDDVTYAHKLSREDGHLDWQKEAEELERAVRALNPWPGTWFSYKGQVIKVYTVELHPEIHGEPGVIQDNNLTVACGYGSVRLLTLQRPGGQALSAQDFLNGFSLSKGTRLLETHFAS